MALANPDSAAMSEIRQLPFCRGDDYPVCDLLAFEVEARRCRWPLPNWWKVWDEELAPTASFVRHNRYIDSWCFRLMPSGHGTDVSLVKKDETIRLQITVSDPAWSDSSQGYDHHLRMKLLESQGHSPVMGPIQRNRDTHQVEAELNLYSRDESDEAVVEGLVRALNGKSVKDGSGQILLVWLRGHISGRGLQWFKAVVARSVARATENRRPFIRTCFGYAADDLWC